jgi:FAD/FMN-containing dehydrogenase
LFVFFFFFWFSLDCLFFFFFLSQGGGHNYAGFSQGLPTGMQLNLQKMCNISNATIEFGVPAIRVGPGCVFDNVYRYLQSFWPSKNLAGGFCPLVGVSGFHLGGGIGPLTREFGIGADSVLQATVVTVNGSAVVTANANSNADLFFALRGGAGGSFGVVTEWVLAVHPSQPLYSYGEYCPEGLENQREREQFVLIPCQMDWNHFAPLC